MCLSPEIDVRYTSGSNIITGEFNTGRGWLGQILYRVDDLGGSPWQPHGIFQPPDIDSFVRLGGVLGSLWDPFGYLKYASWHSIHPWSKIYYIIFVQRCFPKK